MHPNNRIRTGLPSLTGTPRHRLYMIEVFVMSVKQPFLFFGKNWQLGISGTLIFYKGTRKKRSFSGFSSFFGFFLFLGDFGFICVFFARCVGRRNLVRQKVPRVVGTLWFYRWHGLMCHRRLFSACPRRWIWTYAPLGCRLP